MSTTKNKHFLREKLIDDYLVDGGGAEEEVEEEGGVEDEVEEEKEVEEEVREDLEVVEEEDTSVGTRILDLDCEPNEFIDTWGEPC